MATIDEILGAQASTETGTTPTTSSQTGTDSTQTDTAQPKLAGSPQNLSQESRLGAVLKALGFENESEADKAKREKKERREKMWSAIGDGISALSNLYFAGKTGYSNYDPTHSMSAKTTARLDKLNRERQEKQHAYADAYLRLKSADDANEHFRQQLEFQIKQAEENRAQRQKEYDRQQTWRDEDLTRQQTWREEDKAERQALREKEDERWQKQFDQQARQFKQSLSVRSGEEKNLVPFPMGEGKGTIKVNRNALNTATVNYLYGLIPDEAKAGWHGEEIMSQYTNDPTGKYKAMTDEDMLGYIGAYLASGGNVRLRNALRELSGGKADPGDKDTQPTNPKDLAL